MRTAGSRPGKRQILLICTICLALAAAAIAAVAALWLHRPAGEPPVQPKEPVVDTVRVLIQTPPEKEKPVQAKPRSKPSEKEKALDNIFEQASELFEDKL